MPADSCWFIELARDRTLILVGDMRFPAFGEPLFEVFKHTLLEGIKTGALSVIGAMWVAAFPTTTVFETNFAFRFYCVAG